MMKTVIPLVVSASALIQHSHGFAVVGSSNGRPTKICALENEFIDLLGNAEAIEVSDDDDDDNDDNDDNDD